MSTPHRRPFIVPVAIAAVCLAFTACGSDPDDRLEWDQLRNAAYPVEFAQPDGVALLKDGEFRQQAAPGSATETVVRLAEIRSFGRIDDNDSVDAAPILVVSPGGSGTFIYLAAALFKEGEPDVAAITLLGDRVAVRSVSIVDHDIVLRMRVRGPDDPFAYLTTEVTRTYTLEGGELILVNEEATDVPSPQPGDHIFDPQRLDIAPGESESVSGTLQPGAIGDYVLSARAGQELQLELRSVFSNAILSVYGLTDGQVLVSVTEFSTRFTGVLPTDQDYAVRVVTLAGDELEFDLDVNLSDLPTTAALPSPTAPPASPTIPTPNATPDSTALPPGPAPATPTPGRPVSGVRPPSESGAYVYLTFDDGPASPFTGEILDLLGQFEAKGTFFVLGGSAQSAPDFIRRAASEGHAIANHTMSHSSLQGLDHEAFFREVTAAQSIIEELAGAAATRCLRPPYGATDSFTRAYAAELGFAVVLWDVDPQDWARPGVPAIVSAIVDEAGSGRIILMHDGGGERNQTVAALEQVLAQLSGQGFEFRPLVCA